MEFESLTDILGGMLPYGLVAFLGTILAVLAAVLLLTGRRVNPGLAAAGVGLAALGSAMTAWWAIPADPAAEGAFAGLQLAATTRFVAWLGITVVSVIALVPLALAGALKGPRDVRSAGAAAAAIGVVVLLTAVAGLVNAEHSAGAFFYVRAGGYAALGALVVGAMLSGGEPGHPGRQAGASATLVFAMAVAVAETAARGATVFMLLAGLPTLEVGQRAEVVARYLDVTGGEVIWLLLTIAAGQLVGLVGLASASRDGQAQNWAGAIWLVVLPPLVWFGGHASAETIAATAAALP